MRWYQTSWGVALLGLGGLLLVGGVVFAAVTANFWWQIKQGKGDLLQQKIYSGFDEDLEAKNKGGKEGSNVLENKGSPFLGNPSAPITIVLFGDFRCPNTKNAWPILQRLLGQYGHKVKLIFRHFPAESIPGHQGANKLSQIAVCAYGQGQEKYWGVHNYFFTRQNDLPTYLGAADLSTLANEVGLDLPKLNDCLVGPNALYKINEDYADGLRFGVRGTPTFFINGQKIEGVIPWEVWEGFVKQF
ncbi:MAG: hypothetical protein A2534_03055 [Candidatus Magasanikbacteria bacterium RIFOXYD2_FULL_39_9]|uniref:Thioredoxin-like fold domain-containing protein n=1 Tax=Candidatus Magasanikbacteria bacterium RIFOXYD1_FULL_40_23 TaxID=1798705 RepID=A0A1F6P8J3_9BACT|nr:MAG: hypothetical protein A2563_04840 [Candidatus Magasanikbacteria bacterium RIFOXYD1_FULL_40_23]OGH93490.1 MAG: hypothetical protein A2534_03055 [Candidatus Magasanikbacteria bacterium RIFOXYD2_FULL_39_9]